MLLQSEILDNYTKKKIHISPFCETNFGPNSYDVTLDSHLKIYDLTEQPHLDIKKDNKTISFHIPLEGFVLLPNQLYIGSTVEEIGSDYFVPMYEGRSSLARLGINSHQTAGFGDIGFKSKWTLEISVIHPVKIYPHIRIGQIYFSKVNESAITKRYSGKYEGQSEPLSSKSFLDFYK